MKRGVSSRSGATYNKSSSPASSEFSISYELRASMVELRNAAFTPSCLRVST